VSQGHRRAAKGDRPAEAARTKVVGESARRAKLGPFSMESVFVLGLIGLIAGASFLVNAAHPARVRTNTTYGQATVKTHTVGQGGIQPGEIQARTLTPAQTAMPDQADLDDPTPTPVPKKTQAPVAVPSAAPTAGTVVVGPGSKPGGDAPKPGGCILGALLCGAKATEPG
jgi:hypothetical protein